MWNLSPHWSWLGSLPQIHGSYARKGIIGEHNDVYRPSATGFQEPQAITGIEVNYRVIGRMTLSRGHAVL